MQKTDVTGKEIKLVGISVSTNNHDEFNPDCAKIGKTMQAYFAEDVPGKILFRSCPGKTFCVYTNYESDYQGQYTYFIGEEVTSFSNTDPNLSTLTIPIQSYVKFTTEPGPMPQVVIDMWQKIWGAQPQELGGTRAYIADFEIYDERSSDSQKAVVDIYIGIKAEKAIWIGETNITPLLKAFAKFERFRLNDQTEQERAGIIQAFEYCFELSWKTMKRLLQERGKTANSPRETFRMAALEGFIQNPEIWFDFIKKRNLTSHTYQEEEADRVLAICPLFAEEVNNFLNHVRTLNG